MKLRDLALVDASIARAREQTTLAIAKFQAKRKSKKLQRPPSTIEEIEARRSKLARNLDRMKATRLLRDWRRDREMYENADLLQVRAIPKLVDPEAARLACEAKGARYQKDVRVRELLAAKLHQVAGGDIGRGDVARRARKLEDAGKRGHWGVRESDGSMVVRLLDRSGLVMLDPAEARERTAELIERLTPVLLECSKRGYQIHKAVFSEPNIPAGQLAWGKKHIFDRFTRTILERDTAGQARRSNRVLPEIVAAFAVQEDPLAGSLHHWNTHLNVILIVDPKATTPLDREHWPEDPDTGEVKADPAAAAPGMFSYMKLQHTWGAQVEIRRLKATLGTLLQELREVIKYSCKTVSEKSLEKFERAPGTRLVDDQDPGELELEHVDATSAVDAVTERRARAPAMIDWSDARILEWLDANKGFRRVRAWGVLYRLGKIERTGDPDDGIRWMGRIWISTAALTVQLALTGGLTCQSWFNTGGQVPARFDRSGIGPGARASPLPA
jgi:hypothetical protein